MKTELKVGLFAVFSFIILIVFISYLGKSSFKTEGKEYDVVFGFLNDLKAGANVKFAGGILIGYVKSIRYEDLQIKVRVWIKKDFPIAPGVKFSVLGEGVLGEKYLNVIYEEAMDINKMIPIKPGSQIEGKNSVNFDDILRQVSQISEKLTETLDEVNFLLSGITKRKDVEKITQHTIKLLKETAQIVDDNKSNVSLILKETLQGMRNLNVILSRDFPNLVKDANYALIQTTNEIAALSKDFKNTMSLMQSGQGVLGKLLVDKKMAKDLEETVINLKKISERILDNPIFNNYSKKRESFSWEKRSE